VLQRRVLHRIALHRTVALGPAAGRFSALAAYPFFAWAACTAASRTLWICSMARDTA